MASTKYTYSITLDFSSGVNLNRLADEINKEGGIVPTLDYINTNADDCDIWFTSPLSTGEQTTLGNLVTAHSGTALPAIPPPMNYTKLEAGETIAKADAVYISTGKFYKAKAESGKFPAVGFANHAATSGEDLIACTTGISDVFSSLSAGSIYYLSDTTAGAISTSKPASQLYLQRAGIAITATKMNINLNSPAPKRIFALSTHGSTNSYVLTNSQTYTAITRFIFPGTNASDGAPNKIKTISMTSDGATDYSIKIYDFTNGYTIGEVTGQTNTGFAIVDIGTLSNLPTGEAIFEICVKVGTEGSGECRISGVQVEW